MIKSPAETLSFTFYILESFYTLASHWTPYLFYNFYLSTYLATLYVPTFPLVLMSAVSDPMKWDYHAVSDSVADLVFESSMLEVLRTPELKFMLHYYYLPKLAEKFPR